MFQTGPSAVSIRSSSECTHPLHAVCVCVRACVCNTHMLAQSLLARAYIRQVLRNPLDLLPAFIPDHSASLISASVRQAVRGAGTLAFSYPCVCAWVGVARVSECGP